MKSGIRGQSGIISGEKKKTDRRGQITIKFIDKKELDIKTVLKFLISMASTISFLVYISIEFYKMLNPGGTIKDPQFFYYFFFFEY